ncbi:FAD-dependent oxidoreductase, partial [bacterium]|nr:FAD-dependent oxidoreductase [bacterium]
PAWHKSNPGLRGIPWRTLLSASFTNVATGGRSVSCDPRALDSLRLMSRCMATGQAAGVSAALAAQADGAIPPVGYASVRESLLGQGAILE